jgi:hypothetical protein
MGRKKNKNKSKKRPGTTADNPATAREAPASTPQTTTPHKRLLWGTLAAGFVAIATILGFGNDILSLIEHFFPQKRAPIVLSSPRIDLGSGSKKAINNFSVRNIGEIDLYQVVVKLLLDSTVLSITNDDIRVTMQDVPSTAPIPLRITGDPFRKAIVAHHGMIMPGRDFEGREAL